MKRLFYIFLFIVAVWIAWTEWRQRQTTTVWSGPSRIEEPVVYCA